MMSPSMSMVLRMDPTVLPQPLSMPRSLSCPATCDTGACSRTKQYLDLRKREDRHHIDKAQISVRASAQYPNIKKRARIGHWRLHSSQVQILALSWKGCTISSRHHLSLCEH